MSSLAATPLKEEQDGKKNLRILELLPNLVLPLAVNPGIPDNFIALAPGSLSLCDWIYWGPKNVLEAYFENPESLEEPILAVQLSFDVFQTGPNSFSHEDSLKTHKEDGLEEFISSKSQWGDDPVLVVRGTMENQLFFIAWVGLNNPENGATLVFNLVYPMQEGRPNKKDRDLWENLLTKTTQFTDRDYFRSHGQDLNDGYTLVTVGKGKMKMIAEKRQSDGMLQVIVIPESPEVEFRYIDMMEDLMEAQWRYKEPLVKVHGETLVNRGNYHSTTNHVTSIFYKTVPEFSFNKEEEKELLIFQKKP
jgi:hypothetical protein